MPRWLVASLIALVLSCYGFAAAAQVRTGAARAAIGAEVAALDNLPANDAQACDVDEESADVAVRDPTSPDS
jgi:hypothetical protein